MLLKLRPSQSESMSGLFDGLPVSYQRSREDIDAFEVDTSSSLDVGTVIKATRMCYVGDHW